MKHKIRIIFGAFAITCGSGVMAQGIASCAASDLPCIDTEYVMACRTEESTRAGCMQWLGELEASPIADTPNARVIAASAYNFLAKTSEVPEEMVQLRTEATQILHDVLERNPSNVQALLGLSLMAETNEEKIALFEQIVSVDPSYFLGWESLAKLVADDPLQSAQYLEMAYAALPEGPKKWEVASNVIAIYRRTESTDLGNAFIERVRGDFDWQRKNELLSDIPNLSPTLRAESLSSICSASAIALFGGTECLTAIEATVEYAKATRATSVALGAAEDAADAMVRAAGSGWRMDDAIPGWRTRFLTWLGEITESGTESAPIYVAEARLETDQSQRLSAMREAARLAPFDGDIAFGLGVAYLDLESWNEAIRELSRAKRDLPPSDRRQSVIDGFLERAGSAIDE